MLKLLRVRLVYLICFILFTPAVHAQIKNSPPQNYPLKDSIKTSLIHTDIYRSVTDSNMLLNLKGTPQVIPISLKKNNNAAESFFYILTLLMLTLGLLKTLYSRYFSTLFRVFFNTSLRQNQLTDQLEQAKLPSLIFNIFFAFVTGLYICLTLRFFSVQAEINYYYYFIGLCVVAVGICYLIKYISLRFIGWITNHIPEANAYIFIIFLLNKITGIILLPFIILITFSSRYIAGYALFASGVILALFLLMRFYKSYSFLRSRLKLSTFHFLLYVLALEVCPLAVIYKGAILFFGINA